MSVLDLAIVVTVRAGHVAKILAKSQLVSARTLVIHPPEDSLMATFPFLFQAQDK